MIDDLHFRVDCADSGDGERDRAHYRGDGGVPSQAEGEKQEKAAISQEVTLYSLL